MEKKKSTVVKTIDFLLVPACVQPAHTHVHAPQVRGPK